MPDDALIDRYAELAVRSGLNLQPGQQLVLTAPLEAAPLVARVAEHAYRAGASLVTPLYNDDAVTLARFRHAPDEAFDVAAGWLYDGTAAAFRGNAARMAIAGDDPALLSGQNPDKVARANRARSRAYKPAMELITSFAINWSIVAYPTRAWARSVFPDLPEDEAVERLWGAILACTRADQPDPVAAWKAHAAELDRRATWLNERRFHSLRYRGPGTDLTLGLADDHEWLSAGGKAQNGVYCLANIPTEEVFTMPHRDRAEGTVRSTKPLSYQGTLIDGIRVRFEGGRIVEARADRGEETLQSLLSTDEGAARLGEVALVPQSSPISQSGLLFNNTLYDENAASHIAVGQAYPSTIRGGATRPAEELAERGMNRSLVHVDWMIGSGEIDVDGVHADGRHEPVMRAGEWAN
ncbi:aminopeptidase [Rubellimicrobium roseum]|uniref:Aminopeptidase n=1 Tax=Rubellimicrobium roseum TaxID=687525 RepID=A0A5C4N7Q7_9RHOB|nr:aminopeptidase [Rubellimicrobium roseum]TNC66827.1 aminopeptidase [Rubellimicrobium roseum]